MPAMFSRVLETAKDKLVTSENRILQGMFNYVFFSFQQVSITPSIRSFSVALDNFQRFSGTL